MILRVNRIDGISHIMCPKTGKPVKLKKCHTVLIANNEKKVNCEHYKCVAAKDYVERRGLGQEYLSGDYTHIVCGYDGPIHDNWEEWPLDSEWGLYRGKYNVPEKNRKRIIEESKPIIFNKDKKEVKEEELDKTQMKLFEE